MHYFLSPEAFLPAPHTPGPLMGPLCRESSGFALDWPNVLSNVFLQDQTAVFHDPLLEVVPSSYGCGGCPGPLPLEGDKQEPVYKH